MPRKKAVATIDLSHDPEDPPTTSTAPSRKRSAPATVDGTLTGAAASRKKGKRAKELPSEPEEKRQRADGSGARWRVSPTAPIQARIDRALSQGAGAAHRLYLIDTEQLSAAGSTEGARQKFAVMGTTGNVYDVTIGRHSTCTCPDRVQRSSICKHMLFVMLRVLRRARTDPLIWQDALLTSEVDELLGKFGSSISDQSVMANARARQAYKELTGKAPADGKEKGEEQEEEEAGPSGARPLEGQDCPICYETMEAGGEKTTFCVACRNSMHELCFSRWAAQKQGTRQQVTCVYCRTPWPTSALAATPGSASKGGHYLNLATQQQQAHQPSYQELYGREQYHWRQNSD